MHPGKKVAFISGKNDMNTQAHINIITVELGRSHGQGADIFLTRCEKVNCGERPILTHHARNLSRKVAASCREHLPNVGRPSGSLVLSAAE